MAGSTGLDRLKLSPVGGQTTRASGIGCCAGIGNTQPRFTKRNFGKCRQPERTDDKYKTITWGEGGAHPPPPIARTILTQGYIARLAEIIYHQFST